MMERYLSLQDRINILQQIFLHYPEEKDPQGNIYCEVPLKELRLRGLPKSCVNPAYWSGLSTGLRTAIILGRTVKFSEKYQYIRFYYITPEQKQIFQQRMARKRESDQAMRRDKIDYSEEDNVVIPTMPAKVETPAVALDEQEAIINDVE